MREREIESLRDKQREQQQEIKETFVCLLNVEREFC